MKRNLITLSIVAILGLVYSFANPGSKADSKAGQEKAFIESYKKALEAKDEKALAGLMSTKGSPAEIVDFYKSMTLEAAGQKIVSIELVKPSAEEAAVFSKAMEMPDGGTYKLPITPTLQLVMVLEEKSENGSNKSTSKSPVAEVDGKLQIILPVPVKASK